MGITTGRGLRTMAIVLAESQVFWLRQIATDRSSPVNRVSVSSVAREVIEHGLHELFRHENTDNRSTDASRTTEAAS